MVQVLQLETCGPPQPYENCDQVLYLIRSDLLSAKLVCDQINSNLGQNVEFSRYGVVVIPRRLHIITSLFESEGVYGHVEFGQYSYEMIPLDEHILSLQFDDVVQNLWLHQETSYLATIAKCIFNLRGVYGDFHHLVSEKKPGMGWGSSCENVMSFMYDSICRTPQRICCKCVLLGKFWS